MAMTLASRLQQVRQQLFVGREVERAQWRAALVAPELPWSLVHCSGPGGIGKTALLDEFARIARELEIPVIQLDGPQIEPEPVQFLAHLCRAGGAPEGSDPLAWLMHREERTVVLLDNYEWLEALDEWLHEVVFPALPAELVLVLASRQACAPRWQSDPGWQHITRAMPLPPLSAEESAMYLAKRAIPDERRAAIRAFTRGFPLALSLVADLLIQRPDLSLTFEAAPRLLDALLERLVPAAPSRLHRLALGIAALARRTTEDMLAVMLEVEDAYEIFAWLRDLPCIELARDGIAPIDLVRDAVLADLRWRRPECYTDLHARLRRHYLGLLRQSSGTTQQKVVLDLMYLHHDHPMLHTWLEGIAGIASGALQVTELRASDTAMLAGIAEREGAAEAESARHWCARQPGNVVVIRDEAGHPLAGCAALLLDEAEAQDLQADPAAAAAWRVLRTQPPLRAGEHALLFRYWHAQAANGKPSAGRHAAAIAGLFGAQLFRVSLTQPGLVHSFLPCTDPDRWEPIMAYGDFVRHPEADYAVDERRWALFGHNWRAEPPTDWLDLMAERQVAGVWLPPASPTQISTAVLDEATFACAVRQGLQHCVRADRLRDNPLLQTRIVTQRAGKQARASERAVAVQALLREGTETLRASPRDLKFYRVLYHTFLQPAATQEEAAALLDLPFSTYRRYLKHGVQQVAEWLWRQEVEI